MRSIKKELLLFLVPTILFCNSCTHTEKVKLNNTISDETIYLKYYQWGIDDEMIIISLNKSNHPKNNKDILLNNNCIYYKLQNDTLYIYRVSPPSEINIAEKFKTKIKFIDLPNYKFIELKKTCQDNGLNFFPPLTERSLSE